MLVFGCCVVEEKKKNVGKCLCDRSMYKVYFFALLRYLFHLIRTQAFSVFSEVSSGGAAARQNNIQMSESEIV